MIRVQLRSLFAGFPVLLSGVSEGVHGSPLGVERTVAFPCGLVEGKAGGTPHTVFCLIFTLEAVQVIASLADSTPIDRFQNVLASARSTVVGGGLAGLALAKASLA
jgi:hypothetical protein